MSTNFSARFQTLAGAAVLISLITLLSRILGFVRSMAQAMWVGTGGVAEPYAIANQLPNILFEVAAGGALAGAVIPLLTGAIADGDSDRLSKTASALLSWTLLVLVPIGAVVVIFASPIVSAFAHMRTEELHNTAVFFLRVFAVQIPLYGAGILCGGILQAHKRFLWPALAPLFSSLVVIGAYGLFGYLADGQQSDVSRLTVQALQVLAWGTTAGVAAMAVTMIGPVKAMKLRIRPSLSFPPGLARKAAVLAFAGIGALVAQQLSMLVIVRMSSTHGLSQTFNVFQYSQAVYLLPYAILVVPIATSAFPRIAQLATAHDRSRFNTLVSGSTRTVIALASLSAALLIAASRPLQLFFASFARGSVDGMASAIAWSAPGLIGFALILQLSRVLYSTYNGRSAVSYTALGWAVVALFSAILPIAVGQPQRTLMLFALAQSLGMLVAGAGLLWAVSRRVGRDSLTGTLRTLVTSMIACAGASAAGWFTAQHLTWLGTGFLPSIVAGLLVGVIALAVFMCVLWVIDRKTIRSVLIVLKKKQTAEPSAKDEVK